MSTDLILTWVQRLSLVGFMVTAFFLVTGEHLFTYTAFAVLLLYLFLAVSYVNHARKNEVNNDIITRQIAAIVLGTVFLIIIITILFNVYIQLQSL